MKNDTTPPAGSWSPAPSAALPRPGALCLTVISALALMAPNASAVLSLTPRPLGDYKIASGFWDLDVPGGSRVWGVSGQIGSILTPRVPSLAEVGLFDDSAPGVRASLLAFSFHDPVPFYLGPLPGAYGSGNSYPIPANYNAQTDSWCGVCSISHRHCDNGHGVPDGGNTAGLLAMGAGGLCVVRRLKSKKRKA